MQRANSEENVRQLVAAMREGMMAHGPDEFSTGELVSAILTLLRVAVQTIEKNGGPGTQEMLVEIADSMLSFMPITGRKQ